MITKDTFKPTPEMTNLAIYMGLFPRNTPFGFVQYYNAYQIKYSRYKTIKNEFEFMSMISLALDTHQFCQYKVDYEHIGEGIEFTSYINPIQDAKHFHQLYYNSLETGETLFLMIRDDKPFEPHSFTEKMFQITFSNYDKDSDGKTKDMQLKMWDLAIIEFEKLLSKLPEDLWHEHELYQ